jgi:DNA-binding NarL/FixJ family response regulator
MIRVVLVDDQKLVRQGVRGLLELVPDIEVVGEASDGAEALTVREREVHLICAGYSNKEIADLLALTEGTVKNPSPTSS